MADAHEVLGLGPRPSAAEVRATYRALARIHHPDRFADAAPEQRRAAEGRMAEINAAYAMLRTSVAGDAPPGRPDAWSDPAWVARMERARAEEARRTSTYRRWEELERRAREEPVTPRLAPERPVEGAGARLAGRPAEDARRAGAWNPAVARRAQHAMQADADEVLRTVEELRAVVMLEDERPRRRFFRRS